MPEVYQALSEYEQAIADAGMDIFSTIRKGRQREEVIEKLIASGVEPYDDVVDWFSFTDGRKPAQPGVPELTGLFDEVHITSLDLALKERQQRLAPDFLLKNGYDEEQFREMTEANLIVPLKSSWMPISRGQQTCVIETDSESGHRGQLLDIWSDELEPRIKADNTSEWVRRLTAAVPSGKIQLQMPNFAGKIGMASFPLGSLEMSKDVTRRMDSILDNPFFKRCVGIRLDHARPDSLAGNKGLEKRQAEVLEQYLRSIGISHIPFEIVVEKRPGVIRHHTISVFGIVTE